jgi:hypothetical protein
MKKIFIFLLLYVCQADSQVCEKYQGQGMDEVRLHYVITNSLLGAMAGADLAGSNAGLVTDNGAARISIGIGGAALGAALVGYLGYPRKAKLSNGIEKFYFTAADGFIGAVILGLSTGYLADTVFPQSGDVPTSAVIGVLAGGIGGGLLGGVYGYRFAVHF